MLLFLSIESTWSDKIMYMEVFVKLINFTLSISLLKTSIIKLKDIHTHVEKFLGSIDQMHRSDKSNLKWHKLERWN